MSHDEHDEPLDLSAWDAEEPPSDFAERVVTAAMHEKEAPPADEGSNTAPAAPVTDIVSARAARRRRATWAIASVAVGLAASLVFHFGRHAPAQGEIVAETRTEVAIGERAVAVLEPGAHLKWNGDDVDQTSGDVFYRVNPGGPFHVRTAGGEVDVKGTCFRVDASASERKNEMNVRDFKVGSAGAVVATLLLVSVYEGKVAVSHAQEKATIGAGQSAAVTSAGLEVRGEGASSSAAAGSSEENALVAANQNLVGNVSEYKRRLEIIEGQKKDLEQKLSAAEEKLAADKKASDGAPAKSEFDLSQDELVSLAKENTLKYRHPCTKPGYRPEGDTLQKLGLAPQDADTIASAYKKVAAWREAQMRPLCQEAVGKSELSEKMPVDACLHLVSDFLAEQDPKARHEAQQMAVDIRAGLRPAPGPNEKVPALTRMMLASVQELKVFEEELAKSFGPDEAHRITYADGLCMGHSTWGGAKK